MNYSLSIELTLIIKVVRPDRIYVIGNLFMIWNLIDLLHNK
jgi:hypothetical protein